MDACTRTRTPAPAHRPAVKLQDTYGNALSRDACGPVSAGGCTASAPVVLSLEYAGQTLFGQGPFAWPWMVWPMYEGSGQVPGNWTKAVVRRCDARHLGSAAAGGCCRVPWVNICTVCVHPCTHGCIYTRVHACMQARTQGGDIYPCGDVGSGCWPGLLPFVQTHRVKCPLSVCVCMSIRAVCYAGGEEHSCLGRTGARNEAVVPDYATSCCHRRLGSAAANGEVFA